MEQHTFLFRDPSKAIPDGGRRHVYAVPNLSQTHTGFEKILTQFDILFKRKPKNPI